MCSPVNESLPQLPDSGCSPAANASVFQCIVFFRRDEETGRVAGRVANYPDISGEASDERQLLILLTREFRDALRRCQAAGSELPLAVDDVLPAPGEQQRFIPIHL